jgi:formylglycine-generating enzyme required for sulfatase activity
LEPSHGKIFILTQPRRSTIYLDDAKTGVSDSSDTFKIQDVQSNKEHVVKVTGYGYEDKSEKITLLPEEKKTLSYDLIKTVKSVSPCPSSATAVSKTIGTSEMVLIPAGKFLMGSLSGEGENDEHPQHSVYLDAYYIDKYEVTFAQYDKFCEETGKNKPSDEGWGRGNRPVINVTWYDANTYAKWAGKRLPTEAEWEKACRAGSTTKYSFGDNESQLGDYAWYSSNSGRKTHPAGEKKPNDWGIYDMHGNVWEWCSDWYDANYYQNSPKKNPTGPASGTDRVLRGGSGGADGGLRSAGRYWFIPEFRIGGIGFRCASGVVQGR